eukprot:CAMPEP_0170501146 /NCGR_PEP_ID=MMETSP0208-20121228/37397_1 /TAXON_ID=197538 /ORGANISM="Strombidium inclinatum, Strain S3" /LENGTH=257 /DNA_ID=CAMNT_0010779541 /DNA_START=864 /DNA_END=1637 /DNA_ORIENTATION=+
MIPMMGFFRKEVHTYERIGSAVVAVGVFLILLDRHSVRRDEVIPVPGRQYVKFQSTLYVDLIMILNNIPGALFLVLNQSLIKKKFLLHVILLNVMTMLIFMTMAILVEDATMDLNPKHGVFGWLESSHAFTTIFLYGFFATFLGTVGYLLSMQFFPADVCMKAFVLEPVLAQVWGCMSGIDLVPNFLTILGVLAKVGEGFMSTEKRKSLVESTIEKESEMSDHLKGDREDQQKIQNHIEKMEAKVRIMKEQAQNLSN